MRLPLALLCVLAPLYGPAQAEPTRIPETNVSLEVPEGFALSDEFPGIGRDGDLTSVLVSQIPAPLPRSREGFTGEALAERGVRLQRSSPVRVNGHDGLLLHATQQAGGVTFRKWILLLGDDRASVLLTATTPLDLEGVHQQALVETLRTATWSPEDSGGALGLRFRVREVAPLRIVRSASNAIVLTDPGHDTSAGATVAPLVSIGSSLSHVQIRDLATFARQRLEQTVSIDEIEVESERERFLDGLAGHEIRAIARDMVTQRSVVVTQLLATDGRRYYLLQGIADAEDSAKFAPLLEAVIASFALTELTE